MRDSFDADSGWEPERYELDEGPGYRFDLGRRDFLKFVGGGLVVLLFADDADAQPGGRGQPGGDLSAWLHVDEDGRVTAYTGKAEVGQDIRTSLTQAVAEELRLPMDSVTLVMADTKRVPYDAGTFGSRTTPVMSRQLREAAAAARESLVALAARDWGVPPERLAAADGRVTEPGTRRSLGYGELTRGRRLTRAVTARADTTPPADWEHLGRPAKKVNGVAMVTGKHLYASDLSRPGMLFGKILRPPSSGAVPTAIDTTGAAATPGVTVVRDRDFVGVTAPSEREASAALAAIEAEWKTEPGVSHEQIYEHLKKTARRDGGGGRGGRGGGRRGSIERGLAAADVTLEGAYPIAYIAHAPLEPRAALAEWDGDELTVWTGTQRPFGVQRDLAEAFDIPAERVRVIVPDTGSGYGGKHTVETATEAARLALQTRKPVKVVWTREEEFTFAYFRPAGLIEIRSGVARDGTLTAWEFHNYNSGGSALAPVYEVPNLLTEFHRSDSPLRQGSYRALAATANVFARETHLDELAHELGMDPLAFRLKNLRDQRLRAVFRAAAGAFRWGGKVPDGHGVGVGGGTEKGGYVATCAEVAVDPTSGEVKVIRAVSAFECGKVVNPDHLKNQIEGSMMMGLGGALFEAIEFGDGTIHNPRFSSYRVPRFSDAPAIEVVLLDRPDLPPAGGGETPIVGIAPAIGNAIFAATGRRLRSLPLAPRGVEPA